jgi:TctA family transporter
MVAHGNDLTVFVTRPVSAAVLLASIAMVAWAAFRTRRRAVPSASAAIAPAERAERERIPA